MHTVLEVPPQSVIQKAKHAIKHLYHVCNSQISLRGPMTSESRTLVQSSSMTIGSTASICGG